MLPRPKKWGVISQQSQNLEDPSPFLTSVNSKWYSECFKLNIVFRMFHRKKCIRSLLCRQIHMFTQRPSHTTYLHIQHTHYLKHNRHVYTLQTTHKLFQADSYGPLHHRSNSIPHLEHDIHYYASPPTHTTFNFGCRSVEYLHESNGPSPTDLPEATKRNS